jgi:hypothetical protein
MFSRGAKAVDDRKSEADQHHQHRPASETERRFEGIWQWKDVNDDRQQRNCGKRHHREEDGPHCNISAMTCCMMKPRFSSVSLAMFRPLMSADIPALALQIANPTETTRATLRD